MLKNESKPPVEDSSKIGGGSVIVEVKDTSSTTHYEGDGKAGNEPYQAEKSTGEFSYTSDTQDTPFGVSLSLLKRNMYLFIWLKAIGSYDSGAFSAVLAVENGMSDSLGLSTLDKGNLAASVFLGNIIGCPVAGHLFGSYNEQNVLNASLIAHTVATFLFAFFPGYYYCVFFRFFIGFTLAFIVVYTPVWVDHFAPRDKKSIWMASHNAGVPLGIMFGYLVGAYFPSFTAIPWEWAFYLKCLLMVPTIVYVGSANPRSLNARGPGALMTEDNNSDTSSPKTRQTNLAGTTIPGDKGVLAQLKTSATTLFRRFSPLIANPVFMCAVFAMSAMYLVATGLQNFVTEYLKEEPFNASILTIMLGFGRRW
ncbi:transporter protein [Angomonas deanei]|uniref:Sugar (And other) transporter/Major Facilitator Superfamily/Uncharacterized MFS-type transporter YbfB/Organic Anion Transporter Polypeptide (OATP) family, putative n=1 Tax=Angomonas deanei TaxID=59799 RepID=A0A7G2CHA4_9TRYP|nr:transporter protein [Angomonas deanei]CAD2218427.1 Sugar (and other) transporter/Major Facilitator Superfamily/Uncharacterised MFS-type transporter YbfB/Organic Anion Transporter Polypeptide (OATP) family, putative [Angomonas deanei]|eukprot:EPY22096.1 transporter protein [Angomonas deanei]